jgi:hypothetical protein
MSKKTVSTSTKKGIELSEDKIPESLVKLSDIIKKLNESMRSFGHEGDLSLRNEYITIKGDEIIMKIPTTLTVTIPRNKVDLSEIK